MKKLNSISLMLMGLGLFVLGFMLENMVLKISILFIATVLNVIAAVKSFKEKYRNK